MIPTKEQWLWEQLGFEHIPFKHLGTRKEKSVLHPKGIAVISTQQEYWIYPDGSKSKTPPPISRGQWELIAPIIANAAQAKLQAYYRDMTPERLREEVGLLIPYDPLTPELTPDVVAAQILSLVMACMVEKIKGIKNPYSGTLQAEENIAYKIYSAAIQAVLEVIGGKGWTQQLK